jgi:hypothetical protein
MELILAHANSRALGVERNDLGLLFGLTSIVIAGKAAHLFRAPLEPAVDFSYFHFDLNSISTFKILHFSDTFFSCEIELKFIHHIFVFEYFFIKLFHSIKF